MRKAQEGDVVKLKSGGGPLMTVGGSIGDGNWCSWWDNKLKIFHTELLYCSQLEVLEEESDEE